MPEETIKIIAQIVGIGAMFFSIFSFQMKTQRQVVIVQAIATALWSLHFALLGVIMAVILNVIGIIRSIIFSFRNKYDWAKHKIWIAVFVLLFISAYILNFLVFIKNPKPINFLIEALPTFGMIATTFAFHMEKAFNVRILSLISSPLWLAYNIINFSIGGMITESVSIVSIIVGIFRHDLKKKIKEE